MHKKAIPLFVIGALMLSGFTALSAYLHANDVSWNGYLSGLMVNFWGGDKSQLIRVNLHNYSIALYQDGVLAKQDKVAAIGNPKDSTATPTGTFRILSKDPWHISTQRVIMPLSLRFSNLGYYFHDIPLTMARVKIDTFYSHGCIRLRHELAEEVFAWTRTGAYVEVYDASLARADGSPLVYLLTSDGYRQPIPTEAIFVKHGYRWEDVAVIPAAELEGLPLGPAIL